MGNGDKRRRRKGMRERKGYEAKREMEEERKRTLTDNSLNP